MPSAAWIAAAKKTPMEPVFYVACESVDAINVTQNLASDWNAGTLNDIEVFTRPGVEGGAGVRPKLIALPASYGAWQSWGFDEFMGGEEPKFTMPMEGFLESVTAFWNVRQEFSGAVSINGYPTIKGPRVNSSVYVDPLYLFTTEARHTFKPSEVKLFAPGTDIPSPYSFLFLNLHKPNYGYTVSRGVFGSTRYFYPTNEAGMTSNFRVRTGTITTKVFDLGTVPNINSRVLFDHLITGASSITYTAEGSATGTGGWVALGAVVDGGEVAPYRYYRITAVMTSTGYDTPEIHSIRVVGGNSQYVYFGDHRNEPLIDGSEVTPYLQSITSVSSKISLKDKPTVGDLTMTLAWMPQTSDLVQSTGKRRSVTAYLGFVGLAKADYEPYFTGVWDGYTADPDKRTFTVKLRDVWKKFKKKIPEQMTDNGATVPVNCLFGHAVSGTDTNSPLNIMDAIVQVADLAKAPDRFIDKDAFSALKAASFTGAEWDVYRILTEQKDSDEMLKELSVTAGVFLIPSANGKLTPVHYETAIAQEPAVTLDAAQILFSQMTPDMADTVTRHNVFFNLMSDEGGKRKSGGSAADYANVYTTVGSAASVIAERDREEVVVGEWFDNWGLSATSTNGTPNPLTKLADRLASWYTPVATVGGRDVATTKTTVTATNVPLRYFADVTPGKMVYVNNLRLPCPLASWDGFSDNVKFMVMGWEVDARNFTLKLDLFQVSPLTYTATPTWYTYNQWDLFPQASTLNLVEQRVVGADGNVTVALELSFTPATDYRTGYYEVWISESGGAWKLYTTIPATAGKNIETVTFPARSEGDYQVSVVTVNARGVRQSIDDAPQANSLVAGLAAIATPVNTGLCVTGGGTVFTGRDCVLSWDASTLPASLLAGYLVEILTLGGYVQRSTTVTDAQFTYTFGMNFDDYAGVPAPTFQVRVSTINRGGSAATSETITVTNSAPAAPTSLVASGELMAIRLDASYPTPDDFDCLEVWSSNTNDRADIGLNPAGTTKTGTLLHSALGPVATRYYWARVRDVYGQAGDWYPASPTAGILGATVADPSELITLLNDQVNSTALTDYLAGTGSFSDVLDTFTPAAREGVGEAGVFATKGQMVIAADRSIQLMAGSVDVNAQILLLDDAIGLKLNSTGTVGAGMLISWTDETHTKSQIQFLSDTFQIAQPDGTGAKSVFTVGTIAGTSTVGISGDLVLDGSLTARAIGADIFIGKTYVMGDATNDGVMETYNFSGGSSGIQIKGGASPTITVKGGAISAGTITGSQFILGDGTTYGKIETYNFAGKTTGIQILDGVTPTITLKGATIQSGNYVSGSAGWKIDANGNAQFNSADIIDTLQVKNGAITANLFTYVNAALAAGTGIRTLHDESVAVDANMTGKPIVLTLTVQLSSTVSNQFAISYDTTGSTCGGTGIGLGGLVYFSTPDFDQPADPQRYSKFVTCQIHITPSWVGTARFVLKCDMASAGTYRATDKRAHIFSAKK